MPIIDEIWDRLEAALKAAAPDIRKSLKKKTTEAKLTKLEKKLGVTLPADLRASLLRHDGQKDEADGLFPEDYIDDMAGEFLLLSTAEIESDWKMWQELTDGGEFAGNTTTPGKGVLGGWWNRGWVPFATDGGGDYLCGPHPSERWRRRAGNSPEA
jgi:cell wall assembly regulator SMI1